MTTKDKKDKQPIAFSFRAFWIGIGVFFCLCALVVGYLWLQASNTIAERERNMASQTVLITYEDLPQTAQVDVFGPFLPDGDSAGTPQEHTLEEQGDSHAAVIENPAEQQGDVVVTPNEDHGTKLETAQGKGLTLAPIEGLYEDTKDGRMPKIGKNKLTPFQAYRRPFERPAGKPIISIAVMGLGISESATRNIIDRLPPDITLVLDPYATNPDFWLSEARSHGNEMWLKLPVETNFYPFDDPGPQTLIINALDHQNLNKLNWVLSRGSGYCGLVTGYDASFMKATNAMRPVVGAIYSRGLGLVDGAIQPPDTAEIMAESMNAPYAHNNVWIDIPSTHEHLAASLRQLEVLAQGQGSSIGFIHISPMNIDALESWVETLPKKGIVLAPLSAQANPKK